MALRTPDEDEYGSPMPAYMRFITVEEWQEGVNRLARVDEFGDPAGVGEFAQMLMAEVGQTHEHLHDLDGQPGNTPPPQDAQPQDVPEQAPAPRPADGDMLYRALAEVLGEEEAVTSGLGVAEFMGLVGRVVAAVEARQG